MIDTTSQASALPLRGQLVGVSISDSEDLSSRGFLPAHVHRTLADIATLLTAAGARIGYGGHLEPGGFTHRLLRTAAEQYGPDAVATQSPPCVHYLAAPLWCGMSPAALIDHAEALEGAVEVVLVAGYGLAHSLRMESPPDAASPPVLRLSRRSPGAFGSAAPHGVRGREHVLGLYKCAYEWRSNHFPEGLSRNRMVMPRDDAQRSRSIEIRSDGDLGHFLSGYRDRLDRFHLSTATAFSEISLFMAADEDARVVLGGKTRGYAGHLPGIAEEAFYSLLAGNPVVGLRAFGGCADDVVEALLSGQSPDRPRAGPANTVVLNALAAGGAAFNDSLARAGLAETYAHTAALDSPRAMAIGVLKCLNQARWRDTSSAALDSFRDAIRMLSAAGSDTNSTAHDAGSS